jgi:nitroreductase
MSDLAERVRPIRRVRQIRVYRDEPVPAEVIDTLLELARWTGSSRNEQHWRFVVVRDRETLREIAALRPNVAWVERAPVGIAIAFEPGSPITHAYDEGRVTERLLTGANLIGYGGGVAWFGDDSQQAEAKRLLGIPNEWEARQIVIIGRPASIKDPRRTGPPRGRKPVVDLVSYEKWGRTASQS